MQFLLHAYDAKDDGAKERRMKAREAHIANVDTYKEKGHIHMGAALLDDNGEMIGSSMILEFSHQDDFNNWLSNEPYVTQKVWEDIKVYPCQIGPSFQK